MENVRDGSVEQRTINPVEQTKRKGGDILSKLDEEQKNAVTAPPGPLCIIAGAGTGKTTALVGRIAYQVHKGLWQPQAVLAVTHSTKAAGNMRDRLRSLSQTQLGAVRVKTFHAAALEICREHWVQLNLPPLVISDSPYPTVRLALARLGEKDPDITRVFDIAAEIGWAKASLIPPEGYPAAAPIRHREVDGRTHQFVAKAYLEYNKQLARSGQVDFTDLLTHAARLLKIPEVAAQVSEKVQHLLVDEYQDTDPAQAAFTMAVLAGRHDITVVGDPLQAIYGFKGSDVGMLGAFPSQHPGCVTVRLYKDYRSSPQIVKVANTLVGATKSPPGLLSMQDDGPAVEVTSHYSESSEASAVATLVADEIRTGTPAGQIAVLYRYNAQSAPFEQALAHLGVPYTVLDTEKFFDRPEVLTMLRAAWGRMLTYEAAYAHVDDLDSTGHPFILGTTLLDETLEEKGFNPDSPPAAAGGAREKWEALAALSALARSQPNAHSASARELFAELAHRRDESHEVATQTVTLSTLHKAKGLEWDVVVMPRMVEGSLPSGYATTGEEIAEERRLAYVGVTRAARMLYLTYSRVNGTEERHWPSTVSRFLVEAGLAEPKPKTAPGGKAAGKTNAQAKEVASTPALLDQADVGVHTALLAWRAATAKVEKMPEFSIISDAALIQIATRKPADRLGLLRIPGLGMRKVDKYESSLLELLQRYRNNT